MGVGVGACVLVCVCACVRVYVHDCACVCMCMWERFLVQAVPIFVRAELGSFVVEKFDHTLCQTYI